MVAAGFFCSYCCGVEGGRSDAGGGGNGVVAGRGPSSSSMTVTTDAGCGAASEEGDVRVGSLSPALDQVNTAILEKPSSKTIKRVKLHQFKQLKVEISRIVIQPYKSDSVP